MTEIEVIDENVVDIQLQERALEMTKLKVKWNGSREFLAPIVNALTKIGIEPEISVTSLNVSFTGNKEQLARAMRILRTSGFDTDEAKPKQGDTSWSAYFRKAECPLQIWFYFTSSVCRQVKVGTKMVEQAIYETRCGEDIMEEPPCEIAPISETESTPALTESL